MNASVGTCNWKGLLFRMCVCVCVCVCACCRLKDKVISVFYNICVLVFMYYTVRYFTGLFYAVVRQISMLFIENKDSVCCNTLSYKDFANNLDHNKPLTNFYQICETTHLHRRKWHQADRPHLSRNPTQNHRRLCRLKNLLDCKQKNNKTLADDCDTSHYKIHK